MYSYDHHPPFVYLCWIVPSSNVYVAALPLHPRAYLLRFPLGDIEQGYLFLFNLCTMHLDRLLLLMCLAYRRFRSIAGVDADLKALETLEAPNMQDCLARDMHISCCHTSRLHLTRSEGWNDAGGFQRFEYDHNPGLQNGRNPSSNNQ